MADYIDLGTTERPEYPGEGIGQLQAARINGVLYLSGQGGGSGYCWLWTQGRPGNGWQSLGPTHGVRPCAFGSDSLFWADSPVSFARLNLVTGELTSISRDMGSQGIRFVDGATVYRGDDTLFDGVVHEWIQRGDVRVGQGQNGGLVARCLQPDGSFVDHLLEPGDVQFITFDRVDDALAIGTVKFEERRSVLFWLTRADVDTLGPVPVPAPPTPPPPQPPPPPPPPEPEPTMSVPDLSGVVLPYLRAHIKQLGSLDETDANSFAALNGACHLARTHDRKFGLLEKLGGHRQRDRSVDVLAYDLGNGTCQLVKVIRDAEGTEGVPGILWSIVDDHGVRPISDWKEPYPVEEPDEPGPGPGPVPPPAGSLDAMVRGLIEAAVAPLRAEIAELKARPGQPSTSRRVAIKTDNGRYLTAEDGGGGDVTANRTAVGAWEVFTLEEQ